MSVVAGMRSTVRKCSCISPPGGNNDSWAAVDVDGLTSVGAALSLFSDLPAVVFLLDGIFLLWMDKYREEAYYWQMIYLSFTCLM